MTDNEPEAYKDDTLRSISISPRERLAHIEDALLKIDSKLDMRFDGVEKRLTAVENAQAGQATTAEFVREARILADEASQKAKDLADAATKKATDLASGVDAKAVVIADEQKNLASAVEALTVRLNGFDRKFWTAAGGGVVLVFVSGLIGYFIH